MDYFAYDNTRCGINCDLLLYAGRNGYYLSWYLFMSHLEVRNDEDELYLY